MSATMTTEPRYETDAQRVAAASAALQVMYGTFDVPAGNGARVYLALDADRNTVRALRAREVVTFARLATPERLAQVPATDWRLRAARLAALLPEPARCPECRLEAERSDVMCPQCVNVHAALADADEQVPAYVIDYVRAEMPHLTQREVVDEAAARTRVA